jgi:CheY-like chemotaxis protein
MRCYRNLLRAVQSVATESIMANVVNGKGVLVMDDDPSMHELLSLWLNDAGYDVLDSDMLIEPYAEHAELVWVIIADLNAPKIAMAGTLEELHARFPGAYIIAISGYFQPGPGTGLEMAKQLGVSRVLAKPFSHDQLMSAVSGVFQDVSARQASIRLREP